MYEIKSESVIQYGDSEFIINDDEDGVIAIKDSTGNTIHVFYEDIRALISGLELAQTSWTN